MIFGISKTTLNGVLAFFITTLTVVAMFQIPATMMNPQASRVWLYTTLGCNFALALCRAWVGLLQGDASPSTDTKKLADKK